MDVLAKGELALLQILFEPVQAPWAESMTRAVTNAEGKPVFNNRADLVRGVEQKTAHRLCLTARILLSRPPTVANMAVRSAFPSLILVGFGSG